MKNPSSKQYWKKKEKECQKAPRDKISTLEIQPKTKAKVKQNQRNPRVRKSPTTEHRSRINS